MSVPSSTKPTVQSVRYLQVYVHYSVATKSGNIVQSTRIEEGGNGIPLAFVIGKGWRVPRGWEIALLGRHLTSQPLLYIVRRSCGW